MQRSYQSCHHGAAHQMPVNDAPNVEEQVFNTSLRMHEAAPRLKVFLL